MNTTKLKEIFTNWRVLLLLAFLLFAVIAIQPQIQGSDGVSIRNVLINSTAANAGIANPSPKFTPIQKERILSIEGEKIYSLADYENLIQTLKPNTTIRLETNQRIYTLRTDTVKPAELGLRVVDAPFSNIRKGLDLEGGTRVLLQPAESISADDLDITISSLQQRLNVYGLSDVIVRSAADLSGEKFILIEMAGVTEEEVRQLLASQGKFEAKIGNETVFFGGKKDITYVCRSADCAGIDPRRGCGSAGEGYVCSFFFTITLSPEAADRQAELTRPLTVIREGGEGYLSEDLYMFLDDKEVDKLRIGAELKGRATTSIQISGSGTGATQAEAVTNTLQNMKRLQTIIITGSLPTKLNVVKLDTISPSLGKEFVSNVFLVGSIALAASIAVVLIRYRHPKIVLPMALTLISEIVLIVGFAALVRWNLDLAAIAGIIVMVGTGVDHLIVITDETLKGETIGDWKRKIRNAMAIIIGAYLTTSSGMVPLWFAGAGLLKGFAFTTIAGLTFGVLIARPAYAKIIEILLKD